MKIERNHIIIGLLIIVLAVFGMQYMTVTDTVTDTILEKFETKTTFSNDNIVIKILDVSNTGTTGIIEIKSSCESSFRKYYVNKNEIITKECDDIKTNIKIVSLIPTSFSSYKEYIELEITTIDNTPIDPCESITCGDYCDRTTLYTNGYCINGECKYDSEYNSPECVYVPPADDEPPYVSDEEPPVEDEEGIINTVLMYGIGSIVFLVMLLIIVKRR